MEHFLIAASIVLALSSLASSKERHLMETPDCNSCIWEWSTNAYFRFNKILWPGMFLVSFKRPPLARRFLSLCIISVFFYLRYVSDIKLNCTSLCSSTVLPKRKKKSLTNFKHAAFRKSFGTMHRSLLLIKCTVVIGEDIVVN